MAIRVSVTLAIQAHRHGSHHSSKNIVKIEPGVATARQHFTITDLPQNTSGAWSRKFVLILCQHIGLLATPWSTNDLLPDVQRLWTQVFPDSLQVLQATKEPIFSLICASYFT
jgi:hypothetical protein